jgi:RNA 2',3'-cyclic 3'-phosphodiesterase
VAAACEDRGVRLFVAVWPSAEVVEGLQRLERPAVDGVRWTTAAQWHVTARFLGGLDGPAELSARLRSIPLPAAVATIGPASDCPTPGVLWLPVQGLDALGAEVIRVTADIGEPVDHPFQGHLTLARSRRRAPRGVLGRLAPLAFSGRWEVAEVTVVASTPGGGGSRYEVVDRIPLDA